MGEIALSILKWTFRVAFILAVIISVSSLLALIISYLVVGFSTSVLSDIFATIQIWLPFDLNVILLWITAAGTAYISYKVAILSYVLLNTFIGKQ